MGPSFKFKSELWIWNVHKGAWYFVTLPPELSKEIKAFSNEPRRGFGSVRVSVTIGTTNWNTSIFPDKKRGYVLPIKGEVRKKEGLSEGDLATVSIALR